MSVKDHMLWKSLQEKKALDNRLHEEEDLSAKYAQEVREWAEMARGLMEQLSASESRERAADRQLRQCRQVLKQHNIYFAPSP